MLEYLSSEGATVDRYLEPMCGVAVWGWGQRLLMWDIFNYRRGGLPANDNPLY